MNRVRYTSKLYQMNGALGPMLIDAAFRGRVSVILRDDGFAALGGQVDPASCVSSVSGDEPKDSISSHKLALLDRFVDMAREQNIELYMSTSPVLLRCSRDRRAVFSTIESLTRDKGVPYLNQLSAMQNPAWFNDPNHLNIDGTTIYTQTIADWLSNERRKGTGLSPDSLERHGAMN